METAYEAVFIIDPTLGDEQVSTIVGKYTGVITRGNGVVDDVDRWEPRRLAYEIKGRDGVKRREGIYIVVNFHSEPAAKDELDRIFRISDDNMRFIIIKQHKAADRFPSRIRAAETERREREQAARAAAQPAPVAPPPVTDLAATDNGPGIENAAGETAGVANTTTPLPAATPNTLEGAEGGENA